MIIALTSALSLITLYMRHFYQMKWVNNFLQQEDNDSPNHIKFMYDEIITQKDS